MNRINLTADELVARLLELSKTENVCLLDSCGVGHLGSHLLLAGIRPVESSSISNDSAEKTLEFLDSTLTNENFASIFSLSYDFGQKLQGICSREKEISQLEEPDLFLAAYSVLLIHDYVTGETKLSGDKAQFAEIADLVFDSEPTQHPNILEQSKISSNFSRREYMKIVQQIQEYIRDGETYQTNLTQQFRAVLPEAMTPQRIFEVLRKSHPAAFSAFLTREKGDTVVSISPERLASIAGNKISASPIKGTKHRGTTPKLDRALEQELIQSEKDKAENTMIVDLLRNDLGRICEFGSVKVEKLYELEVHASLFHLVSTISGELKKNVTYSEVIKAIFPSGSITGCPKIRTMGIIDKLENANRGLSMGAIGYCGFDKRFDLNVAIRTMVIRKNEAVFNVGGGIVIDSDPESEYLESLLKAKALLGAINADLDSTQKAI